MLMNVEITYLEREARARRLLLEARGAGLPRRRRLEQHVVLDFLGVADAVANRFRHSRQDIHELRQVAYLGLTKAVKRFDPALSTGIVAFAVPTISGEIKRFIRDTSWTVRPPRSIQELALELHAWSAELFQTLEREPTPRDYARATGEPVSRVAEALQSSLAVWGAPAPRPFHDNLRSFTNDLEQIPSNEAPFEEADRSLLVSHALASLAVLDSRVIRMRFFEEMTQSEIATLIGVSQMQVSRMLERILAELREFLGTDALIELSEMPVAPVASAAPAERPQSPELPKQQAVLDLANRQTALLSAGLRR